MNSKHKRYDERDNIFSRRDLVPGSDAFDAFYESHPELKELDDEWRKRPEFGSGIHAVDMGLFTSPADIMWELGRPDVIDGSPATAKQKLSPQRAALKVKTFASRLGADLSGISPLKQDFVYSHRGRIKYAEEPWGSSIECQHAFAISLGFREDIQLIKTAPFPGELFESALVYYRSAAAAVVLANYIRSLGYAARAHHFRNYQVLSVPLAVEAGLGELARCGFLLTKEYGNCLRLSTVTTDLPLQIDHPIDIGVQDFCDRCKLCADACPSGAIPQGRKFDTRDVMKWQMDDVKCYSYWSKAGTDCGMCIASCPWSQPDVWYHNIAADWASKSKLARILLLWLYPIVYGPYKPKISPDWIEPRQR
ncbi:reductive dehalogenase [bacterium]|nr:reductive dehalogenase [bacterium]MBU1651326.1 reductive dehalogenase [bacterium]MBU1881482.1 reductive dehalogenase [bacterium]